MQLTARKWIELIADPEIREKVKGLVEKYPCRPFGRVGSIQKAIDMAIMHCDIPDKTFYYELLKNPPALLPEREQAEAVLREFELWHHNKRGASTITIQDIADFLNQKYTS